MIKHVSRRFFTITAIYLCIIFGIFALQFTRGDSFSFTRGSLRVSGTGIADDNGLIVPVLPFHASANGIDFFLDDQNPLLAWSPSGKQFSLDITGFERNSDRIILYFEDSVSLSLSSEIRGDVDIVTISASIPQKYQKIALPYKITRSARLEKNDSQILVSSGKSLYYFPGSSIEAVDWNEVRFLTLPRAAPVAHYQTWIPVQGLVIENIALLPLASRASYKQSVEQFAASALSSFRDSLNAGKLTELLVAAYVAEMGRTGMYPAGLDSIPESWKNARARNWQTNTFFNNLEKTTPGLLIKEREDRSLLSRKISENDLTCFDFPSLVPYLIDRGSSVLLPDLSRLATLLENFSRLSARQAAGVLEVMMDYSQYVPQSDNRYAGLDDACERVLKNSLVRIGDHLYVSDDGSSIETLSSIQIGNILVRYGLSSSERSQWAAIGRLLVSSLLSFGGDKAVFPGKFGLIDGATIGEKAGIVAKAEIALDIAELYPVVMHENTWYPHALSLYSSLGPGSWTWTSAQAVRVETRADGSISFTVRFPQGETHYMVIRGIKSFNRIQIYGMDFRTDPRFESYNSSGYRYNDETGTLYLKMRHKSELEEVVIWPGEVIKIAPAELPEETSGSSEAGDQDASADVMSGSVY